jgi:hypothetical protein
MGGADEESTARLRESPMSHLTWKMMKCSVKLGVKLGKKLKKIWCPGGGRKIFEINLSTKLLKI